MRLVRKFGPFFILAWLTLCISTAYAAATPGLRQYFPGDIVHLVIESPIDTVRLKAIMPDNKEITLSYDGDAKLWHGYWEVPYGFKKGLYNARLVAVDLDGASFEGNSSPFYVGEPSLALMMSITPGAAELAKKEASAKEAAVSPAGEIKRQPVRARKPAKSRPKKIVTKDINVAKVDLASATRSHITKFEYKKARTELKELLRMDPNDQAAKALLKKLDAAIDARDSGQ